MKKAQNKAVTLSAMLQYARSDNVQSAASNPAFVRILTHSCPPKLFAKIFVCVTNFMPSSISACSLYKSFRAGQYTRAQLSDDQKD
jgi:hypothetical protein